jgi:tyrosyl-tRNA synthetase
MDMKTVTDPAQIDEFLSRGIEMTYPNKDFIRAKMLRGERLSMYLGVDPTGPTLHLGHAIALKKMADFQALGHQAILLIGDFTATIGDPTDKMAARKVLTRKEVLANAKFYKKQASTFLKFSGANKAQLKYNSKWLGKMKFADVLNLASKVTVDQMLKRDMFEKRMAESKPLYIHEIMYPLLQGYDSVAMNVDGEIGGNDQTFNMLMGRDLSKNILNKEKFVISMKLLVDPSGKKMGKTEGNMVSLDQTAQDMFGKVLSWTDDLILPAFELCTNVPVAEIAEIKKSLENAANPKDMKVRLAKEIVTLYHGQAAADEAEQNFNNTFKKGELPDNVKEVSVSKGAALADILLNEKFVESKGELRRLIEGKAVSEIENGEVISDFNYKIERSVSLRIGKKRFIKISVNSAN